jgi:uncharacterized protein (DUF2141 family)
MIYKKSIIFILLFTFSLSAQADSGKNKAIQKLSSNYSLTVKVAQLRNAKGVVQFALYNKKGTIPDEKYQKMFKKQRAKIVKGMSVFTFKNLPKGRYAVNILHDENSNGKVDKGFMLPIEGVGFSNYKSIGLRNRPNFNKASFAVNGNTTKQVKVIYF